MKKLSIASLLLAGLGGLLPACSLDIGDLNNPALTDLQNNPTPVTIGAACTGLLIGNRANQATELGFVNLLGILGRESYTHDVADGRFESEMLQGPLVAGDAFGGFFWNAWYRNIRLGNVILDAVDKVAELSDGEKSGIRGFTKTSQALDLLQVIVTHDTNGAVIDTDHPLTDPLGALVGADDVRTKIAALLDDAAKDLAQPDVAFPFALSDGFAGFDQPATFLKYNRALRARVAIYQKDYAAALTALNGSFINDGSDPLNPFSLDTGVYYVYSLLPNDVRNDLISPVIFAHPGLFTDVQKNGGTLDARFFRKVAFPDDDTEKNDPGDPAKHQSNLRFSPLYPSTNTHSALIRNEELLLLKAEALFFKTPSDFAGAYTVLNFVRQQSGSLGPVTPDPSADKFTDDLLYERRYSLMFEWGHRWIDLRRFGKPLPLDILTADPDNGIRKDVANLRFPIPQAECNARPGEPRCALGSM